jgi:hypothetical protein
MRAAQAKLRPDAQYSQYSDTPMARLDRSGHANTTPRPTAWRGSNSNRQGRVPGNCKLPPDGGGESRKRLGSVGSCSDRCAASGCSSQPWRVRRGSHPTLFGRAGEQGLMRDERLSKCITKLCSSRGKKSNVFNDLRRFRGSRKQPLRGPISSPFWRPQTSPTTALFTARCQAMTRVHDRATAGPAGASSTGTGFHPARWAQSLTMAQVSSRQ